MLNVAVIFTTSEICMGTCFNVASTGVKLRTIFLNRTEIYEVGHYVKTFWPSGAHLDTQLPRTPPGNRLNCFLSRHYISRRTVSFLVTKQWDTFTVYFRSLSVSVTVSDVLTGTGCQGQSHVSWNIYVKYLLFHSTPRTSLPTNFSF